MLKYFVQHMISFNTWIFSTHEYRQHMTIYSIQHMDLYFIIFFIFQIGMRPNQLPYNVNHMDSIQHMYIIAMINNQPSSKVHHTTVCQPIDWHTTKQSGLVYVKYHPNTRVRFQSTNTDFYLCSWAMCKIYHPNQYHLNGYT